MLDNNETRAVISAMTMSWPGAARQTLSAITESPGNAVSVVTWGHGNLTNFSNVAKLLMHWNNAILLPAACDIPDSTVTAWQTMGTSTAAGAIMRRPADATRDRRTHNDLLALLIPALVFVLLLRHM